VPVPTKTLVLVRHGQAESLHQNDRDRALTALGRRNSRAIGDWLRKRKLLPDYALVSPAERTLQTWRELAAGYLPGHGITIDESLYSGDTLDSVLALGECPDQASVILYLGHNPTVSNLALDLVDSVEPTESGDLLYDLPPAGLVVIEGLEDMRALESSAGVFLDSFVGGADR
jgi:phosphohistidine phosphatase